jgi:hypothetical protein
VPHPVRWQEADLIAASAEGHLAVISEPAEGDFLSDFLAASLLSGQSAWLGATREENLWVWTTGEPWVKAQWAPGSPDGESSDTALRFLKNASGMGWDDADPRSEDVNSFLIEWSPDSRRKGGSESVSPPNVASDLLKTRKVARRLVKKEVDEYRKFLVGNRGSFLLDAKVWFRVLNNSQRELYQETFDKLDENLPADGDLSGNLSIENLPPDLKEYFQKAIERQNRRKGQLDERLESLRRSYLGKLADLRSELEKNGLKSQMVTIDAEMKSVGQTADSFRSAMGE